MVRKRTRIQTLLKLSPLYLLAALLLYVLIFMEKEFDYLEEGRERFVTGRYAQALDYLDVALDENKYRGQKLLDTLMLRARTLNVMESYGRAL
ncbi:MAG: hypothetical protein KJ831_05935, partial [Candidatus Eisenbacteria bacterium]|nr:hypothetical protein [Candidatus Eisenbacteria bacterium]